jgi:hypothetical protein
MSLAYEEVLGLDASMLGGDGGCFQAKIIMGVNNIVKMIDYVNT